jgi:uncharacterized phage-associated protein
MPLGQRFDPQRAVEAILYVTHRVGDPTLLRVSKLLYFADKYHLSTRHRLVTGDAYVAMRNGPVPSEAYDLMKAVRGDGYHRGAEIAAKAFKVVNGRELAPLRDADVRYLSRSARESLDHAVSKYGRMSTSQLINTSHDASWKSADENDFIALEGLALDTPNEKELLAYLKDPFPGDEREAAKAAEATSTD